jgi:hypothetical protein
MEEQPQLLQLSIVSVTVAISFLVVCSCAILPTVLDVGSIGLPGGGLITGRNSTRSPLQGVGTRIPRHTSTLGSYRVNT